MSVGTTGGGAFRFPYEFDIILGDLLRRIDRKDIDPDIRRALEEFSVLYMDRDRALEDYLTAINIPFVVVADDGSGDFTSIKTAVEAATDSTLIYVKPGTYSDSGDGRVTLTPGFEVVVFGSLSHIEIPNSSTGDQVQPTHQAWVVDGVDVDGSGNSYLTIIGIDMQCGSNQVVANMGSGELFRLAVQNGKITGSGDMFGSYSGFGSLGFAFSDSIIQPNMNPASTAVPTIYAVRTIFTTWSSGSTSSTFNHMTTGGADSSVWDVELRDCLLGVASLTWSGNTGFALGNMLIHGCRVGGTAWTFRDNGAIEFSNCTSGPQTISFANTSAAGQATGATLSGNVMQGTTVVNSGGEYHPFIIDGVYSRIVLAASPNAFKHGGGVANVVLVGGGNAANAALTISGSHHVVQAVFEGGSGTSHNINVSGDNNIVIWRGTTTTVTNTGSDNWINSLPPTGAASGDLGGSYPDPTVVDITELGLFDAKGDLLVATANNTPARLAVGTDDQVLTADSGAAGGVSWQDASGGGGSATFGDAAGESVFGDDAAEGTSSNSARADHTHGRQDDAALFYMQVSV